MIEEIMKKGYLLTVLALGILLSLGVVLASTFTDIFDFSGERTIQIQNNSLIEITDNSPFNDTIIYLPFDFDDGVTSYNVNQGWANGTYSGAELNSSGKYNSAAKFTRAEGDYIEIADPNITEEITVMAWIYKDSNQVSYEGIIDSKYNQPGGEFSIWLKSTSITFGVATDPSTYNGIERVGLVNNSQWHHIALTFSLSEGLVKAYYDGSKLNQFARTVPLNISNYPIHIGGGQGGTITGFDGLIDEVYIINNSLSETQIGNYYNENIERFKDNSTMTLSENKTVDNPSAEVLKYNLTNYYLPAGTSIEFRTGYFNDTDAPSWTEWRSATEIGNSLFSEVEVENYENFSTQIRLNSDTTQFFSPELISSTLDYSFTDDSLSPVITLNAPTNGQSLVNNDSIVFYFTATDVYGIENCSLWHNATGTWHLNATNISITNGEQATISSVIGRDTNFIWNIQCYDSSGAKNSGFASSNYSILNLNISSPVLTIQQGNIEDDTLMCETSFISNVSVYDEYNLSEYTLTIGQENLTFFNSSMILWLQANNLSSMGENDTVVADISPNYQGNYNLLGGATYNSSGKYGGAMSFDGSTSQYADLGESLITTENFTISTWFNLDQIGGFYFFVRQYTGGDPGRFFIGTDLTTNRLTYRFGETYGISDDTLETGVWYNAIFVKNGSTMRLYLNGELENTGSDSNTIYQGANTLVGYTTNGSLDDVMIFDRALNEEERDQLLLLKMERINSTTYNFYFNKTGMSEGNYEIKSYAENSYGVSGYSDARDIEIDCSAPVLTYDSTNPTDASSHDITSTITLKVNSDEVIDTCTVYYNETPDSQSYFNISIDQSWIDSWDMEYPVTYEFDVPSSVTEVYKKVGNNWVQLDEKTSEELFNGVEAVRFNDTSRKAYVSVAFNNSNIVELKFNAPGVSYNSTKQYYDNRVMAMSLSNDNWGANVHGGVDCNGDYENDSCDAYQASSILARQFNIPITFAVNTNANTNYSIMQNEINLGGVELAVHTRTHPINYDQYQVNGYEYEIVGGLNDMEGNLTNFSYTDNIITFILPNGYNDTELFETSADHFLFLREYGSPVEIDAFPEWYSDYRFYYGGWAYTGWDGYFQSTATYGDYDAADVAAMQTDFDEVYADEGIYFAMWHSDRYNASSVNNDTIVDGHYGSSLLAILNYTTNRNDVWYVANGWLSQYHKTAENATVTSNPSYSSTQATKAGNSLSATYILSGFSSGDNVVYYFTCNDSLDNRNSTAKQYLSFTSTPTTVEEDTTTQGGGGIPTYYPTESNLQEGYSKQLYTNWKLNFKSNGESHQLKLDSFNKENKTATITISSEPQTKTLSVEEEWRVNLDNDSTYDLLVRLENVTAIRANVFIQEINESISGESEEAISDTNEQPEDNIPIGDEEGINYWLYPAMIVIVLVLGFLTYFFMRKYKKRH